MHIARSLEQRVAMVVEMWMRRMWWLWWLGKRRWTDGKEEDWIIIIILKIIIITITIMIMIATCSRELHQASLNQSWKDFLLAKNRFVELSFSICLFHTLVLRNSASSFHWLSSSIFSCSFVCPSRIVTPDHISTIWCFRPYKPYIFCEDMILATCQCHSLLSWAQFTVV